MDNSHQFSLLCRNHYQIKNICSTNKTEKVVKLDLVMQLVLMVDFLLEIKILGWIAGYHTTPLLMTL